MLKDLLVLWFDVKSATLLERMPAVGYEVSDIVGKNVGIDGGKFVGTLIWQEVGDIVRKNIRTDFGEVIGVLVQDDVGDNVGNNVGTDVGELVGSNVGMPGICLGRTLG